MPDIQIPGQIISLLQLLLAFVGAFAVALWIGLIIWTFRDVRSRSRDIFAILLATLMAVIFGPLGLILYYLLRPQVTLAELYERSLEEEALLQDLEERPRCSGCSRVVKEHWIVCPDCHTQLKRICYNCNEKLNLRWNVCPGCGAGVNQAAASRPGQVRNQGAAATQQTDTHSLFKKRAPATKSAPQTTTQAADNTGATGKVDTL